VTTLCLIASPLHADDTRSLQILFGRQARRQVQRAEECLAQKDYAGAIDLLQPLLAAEDGLVAKAPQPQSLHARVEALLLGMDEHGRELYNARYAETAERELARIRDSAPLAAIDVLSSRYGLTPAGHAAIELGARRRWERGDTAAAAVGFERFLALAPHPTRHGSIVSQCALAWTRAGARDRAREVLRRYPLSPAVSLRIGGREVRPPASPEELDDWLQRAFGPAAAANPEPGTDWRMLHGNAQRIPLLGSGGRDIPGWRAEALFADGHREEDSALMRRARTRLQALDEAEFAFIGQIAPARHPLVVGNLVLARTLENLVAFDLRDGRRVWETPAGVLLRRDLLQPFSRELRTPARLFDRAWHDWAAGAPSSDGELVFCVESDEPPTADEDDLLQSTSSLAAYELSTGRRRWTHAPESSRVLGAPVPHHGTLACLVDCEGEIRLLVLRSQSGELLWSQRLCAADPKSASHRGWRNGGLSVALSSGLIVCPTQMGAVFCLDPASRSIVWVCEYPRTLPEHASGELYRWLPVDGIPRVQGRYLLLAPADINAVMCLDAIDGRQLWSRPLPAAGCFHIAGERVLIVGRRETTAHRLADGNEEWRTATPPPAGLGVCDGRTFYLPRRDGSIAVIDVERGALTGSLELPGGARPGNLIRIPGGLLSQGLEDLAWRPDDREP
jgi:hypothetical protein